MRVQEATISQEAYDKRKMAEAAELLFNAYVKITDNYHDYLSEEERDRLIADLHEIKNRVYGFAQR